MKTIAPSCSLRPALDEIVIDDVLPLAGIRPRDSPFRKIRSSRPSATLGTSSPLTRYDALRPLRRWMSEAPFQTPF